LIYEYECPNCLIKFDIVKHHSEYLKQESCAKCGTIANKLVSAPMVAPVEKSEYNLGLGCVVRGKKHKKELLKQRNLVEVGNEPPKTIHNDANKQLNSKLSWEGV